MQEDFFKSDVWKKATPQQRIEFMSKMRASKQIEKEKQKSLAPPPLKKSLTKRQKRRKQREKKEGRLVSSKPSPVIIAGVDVTTDAFLLTYEWRKLRMQALKKYEPKCMCCGATPATGAVINVDHIKPRKLFPQFALDINNLQILCNECNHGKGNWDQTDWRPNKKGAKAP